MVELPKNNYLNSYEDRETLENRRVLQDRRTIPDRRSKSERRTNMNRREEQSIEEHGQVIDDISDFRLSLKEVGFILAVIISVASTLFNFNSQIEKTNSAQAVINERNVSIHLQLKEQLSKQEDEIKSLKEQVTNIDQITTLMYQQKTLKR